MMDKPNFTDGAAIKAWDAYFAEVDALLRRIGDVGGDLGDELRAHLADSYAAQTGASESARLNNAIEKLGRPADYLQPMLASAILEEGARSYNPVTIGRGLYHSILAGSRLAVTGALFAIGYVFLAAFTMIAVLKPFWGDHVGLLRDESGAISFGIQSNANGTQDLLGFWTIPVSLAAAALLYVALTRALRRLRPKR